MKTITTKEPGKQEFRFSRSFNAPKNLVFKIYTDPDKMADWWGPAKYKIEKLDMNVKSGGSWSVIQSDESGQQFGFHGVYHEVKAPDKITWTFEFDGTPGHVSLETIIFEEESGETKVIGHSVYQSLEDRDAMIEAGMEEGLNEGLDRLEKLIERSK